MKANPRMIALGISGIGLILLGAAVAFYIPYLQNNANLSAVTPVDISAVPAKVQFDAPSLSLADLNGVEHSLSDYRGQTVLVNLWATWCPPCKAEMPAIQDFYSKYQSEGFNVVAIEDGDPTTDVAAFVNQFGLTFTVLVDPTYQATDRAFKTANLPSSYVIDRNGQVRLEWVGAISEQNLEKYVIPIIKE
ncbi:MAG: redoxin domain-containing protein [Chloroflexi bacterium]|nr:redoxin domain-containing protein [Chloroflexota bacterium]